jgi:two-component system, response regulator YesN
LRNLTELFDLLANKTSSHLNNSRVVLMAKKYVAENYNNGINLETVANSLHINYSYLSQTFKKETGVNFTDHISQYRVEKAKILLQETDYALQSISRKVGFVDAKHFSKVFKKYTGLSPMQYKRSLPLAAAKCRSAPTLSKRIPMDEIPAV